MKNRIKLLGAALITALLVFAFAACKDSDSEDPSVNWWSEIYAYLDGLSANNTGNPYDLRVDINLGDMDVGSDWWNLLHLIATKERFVSLDLSSCTMSNTLFYPDKIRNNSSYNETMTQYIVGIILPDTATSIEGYFSVFNNLASVTIGNSVTSIGNSAFSYCYNLTSIVIPDSVTSIGNSVFTQCPNLTSIIIGSGVTSIGSYFFEGCNSLTSVTFRGTLTADNIVDAYLFVDLWEKYLAGGIGTYTRPDINSRVWTKQ